MPSPTDVVEALEARLDLVHEHVLEIRTRLGSLESSLDGQTPTSPTCAHPRPRTFVRAVRPHTRARAVRRGQHDTQPMAAAQLPRAAAPSVGAPARVDEPTQGPMHAPQPRPSDTQPGSHPTPVQEQSDPARAMAAVGGTALLLGLVCLAIYAIEQDWLTPGLRFGGSLLLSAALTMAAWPIARRGHVPVAGAVGGAGLGAWMASWLFARHVHELASGGQVFIALAAGAGACLLIADRLRLRLMAVLAGLAACVTPVLVGGGRGSLAELMVYQLAVVAILMVVDWRRRWPELPTLALMATWILGGRWAAMGVEASDAGSFMAWTCAVLVASSVSTWRSLMASADAMEASHARTRLLVGGLVSWAAAAWAFAGYDQTLAMATLGLGMWHGGLAWVLHRRACQAQGEQGAAQAGGRDLFATGLFGLAWLQAMAAGALMFTQAAVVWYWVAMSMAAVGLAYKAERSPRWGVVGALRGALILAPALAAVVYCVSEPSEPWAFSLSLCAALVPLAASFVLRAPSESEPGLQHRPHPQLALLSTLMWAGLALGAPLESIPARLLVGLVPVALICVGACLRPTKVSLRLAVAELGAGSFALLVALAMAEALDPTAGSASEGWALAMIAAGLGALCIGVVAGARQLRERGLAQGTALDMDPAALGLLAAASMGISLALASSALVMQLDASLAMARLGHTLALALAGLGLLRAGLGNDDETWRQLGLAAICAAAGKIIFFDLAGAAFVWRALSFAGIGVVFIAGAFFYSRAQKQLEGAS